MAKKKYKHWLKLSSSSPKEEAQNLLDLRKDKVELCLQKNELLDMKARVAVVLDYSLSMRNLGYSNFSVQSEVVSQTGYNKVSDGEIYDRLLLEFPSWLKQPKVEG